MPEAARFGIEQRLFSRSAPVVLLLSPLYRLKISEYARIKLFLAHAKGGAEHAGSSNRLY